MHRGTVGTEELGNTKPTLTKEGKHRSYLITWFYDKDDHGTQMNSLFKTDKYIYQIEKCTETGRLHIQGVVVFKSPRGFTAIKKAFPSDIHWEVCRSTKDSIKYCQKNETRVKGPFTNNPDWITEEIEDYYIPELASWWQKEILELINKKPDPRKIHWYYEPVGAVGKTTLARHMVIKYGAAYLSGKGNDMLYAVSEMKVKPKIIIIDLSRTLEGHVSYSAIEKLKDGIFFSGKYESKSVLANKPHIIVFANWGPELNSMSLDRWDIKNLSNKALTAAEAMGPLRALALARTSG